MKFWELKEKQIEKLYDKVLSLQLETAVEMEKALRDELSALSVDHNDGLIASLVDIFLRATSYKDILILLSYNTRHIRLYEAEVGSSAKVKLKRKTSDQPMTAATNFTLRPREADLNALTALASCFNHPYATSGLTSTAVGVTRDSLSISASLTGRYSAVTSTILTDQPFVEASFFNIDREEVKNWEEFPVSTFLYQDVETEIVYVDSGDIYSGNFSKLIDLLFPLGLKEKEAMDRVNQLRAFFSDPVIYERLAKEVIAPDIAKGRTTYDRGHVVSGVDALDRISAITASRKEIAPLARAILMYAAVQTKLIGANYQYTDIVEVIKPSFGVFNLGSVRSILIKSEIEAVLKDFVQTISKIDYQGLVLPSDISTRLFRVGRAFARDLDALEMLPQAIEVAQLVAYDRLLGNSSKMTEMRYLEQSPFASFLITNYEFLKTINNPKAITTWGRKIASDSLLSYGEVSLLGWLDRRFAALKPYIRPIDEAKRFVSVQPLGGRFSFVISESLDTSTVGVWTAKIADYTTAGHTVNSVSRESLSSLLTSCLKGMLNVVSGDLLAEMRKSLSLVGEPDFISFATGRNALSFELIAAACEGVIRYEISDFVGMAGSFKVKSLGKRIYKLDANRLRDIRAELIGDHYFTESAFTYLQLQDFTNIADSATAKRNDQLGGLDSRDMVFGARLDKVNPLNRTYTIHLEAAGNKISYTDITLKEILPSELVEFTEVQLLNSVIGQASARLELIMAAASFAQKFSTRAKMGEIYNARMFQLVADMTKSIPLVRHISSYLMYRAMREWMFNSELYTASLAKIEETHLHNQCIKAALLILNDVVRAYHPGIFDALLASAEQSLQWSLTKL